MASYDLKPVAVPKVKTRYRTIRTKIPAPESLPIFRSLQKTEPRSMMGQPPIVWHKADNFTVSDRWGNRWLDWSSGVLITNAGHGRKEIRAAMRKIMDQSLLATYVFVHEGRERLCAMLQKLCPVPSQYKVFLLTTGSEATENCIKLAKTYALEKHGPKKRFIISFNNAFHGRTLGAQLAGGLPGLKKWIGKSDVTFVQVPFPDGYHVTDTSFNLFLKTIKAQGVTPDMVAGVMAESYQGGGADMLPKKYARDLAAWCKKHDVVLIMDEVQAGFGRTGKWFTFQHYGIKPDLIACGKGISSSLPIAAVLGRADILGLYPPGSMTSTHSASPLPVAAAIANIELLRKEKLPERAAKTGRLLMSELERIRRKHPQALGCLHGMGMVAGIQVVKPGTKTPDPDTALRINELCFQRGLLMFAPVGFGGHTLKISPPLTTPEAALREALVVFEQAVDDILAPTPKRKTKA